MPCVVPPWPEVPIVELAETCTADAVCLTEESVIAIALWVRAATAYYEAVTACPGVTETR